MFNVDYEAPISFNNDIGQPPKLDCIPSISITTMSKTKPVALVIGASRGIGRQIAIDLAEHKYSGKHW